MLALENRQAIQSFGERLREIDFTPKAIHESLGSEEALMRVRGDQALQVRRLARGAPLTAAVKLFVIGVSTGEEEARRAFAAVPLEQLEEIGMLERSGNEVWAPVHIAPFDGLVVASDRSDALEDPQADVDHVGSVNPTSMTLAKLTVRGPVDEVLDLGTGCGVQALLAAPHARRVVATDVNPQALRYTEFNALLNGVSNIETRQGSFFEPVEGERFDLVVSNPPFVISPDARFTFRDSGLRGDEVCREVVAGAAELLREAGHATVLCNWVRRAGEEWTAAPARWIESSPCDAWVLNQGPEDPLKYASVWNQFLRVSDPAAYPGALDRWVEYDRSLGVEALHYGAVILRRRSGGRTWRRFDDLPTGAINPAGKHIERVFAAQDYLASLEDEEALLDERFVLVEAHRLEQSLRLREGEYQIEAAFIRLEEGIAFEGAVDSFALHVLARCDGRTQLREALADVARLGGLDEEAFVRSSLRVIRRLFELGFLVRAE